MAKNKTNLTIDTIGYLSFVVLLGTGVIMKYVLVPGSRREAGDPTTLWGWTRHEWGDVHFWAAVVFITAVVIHVWLHWRWLVSTLGNYAKIKTSLGVLAAVIIPFLIAMIPLAGPRGFEEEEQHRLRGGHGQSSIQQEGYGNRGGRGSSDIRVRGRDTLEDVAGMSGIPVEAILKEAGLPSDTPPNVRLSVLREQYGLEMSELRDVISRLTARNSQSP